MPKGWCAPVGAPVLGQVPYELRYDFAMDLLEMAILEAFWQGFNPRAQNLVLEPGSQVFPRSC